MKQVFLLGVVAGLVIAAIVILAVLGLEYVGHAVWYLFTGS